MQARSTHPRIVHKSRNTASSSLRLGNADLTRTRGTLWLRDDGMLSSIDRTRGRVGGLGGGCFLRRLRRLWWVVGEDYWDVVVVERGRVTLGRAQRQGELLDDLTHFCGDAVSEDGDEDDCHCGISTGETAASTRAGVVPSDSGSEGGCRVTGAATDAATGMNCGDLGRTNLNSETPLTCGNTLM